MRQHKVILQSIRLQIIVNKNITQKNRELDHRFMVVFLKSTICALSYTVTLN